MRQVADRPTRASRIAALPTPCASAVHRTTPASSGWLPIVCPVCHTIAHALPVGPDDMSIACTSCGPYRLTHAGERSLTTTPNPIDRANLSRTLRNARALAGEDWPLIDNLTACTLIALSVKRVAAARPPACDPGIRWVHFDSVQSERLARV